MKITKLRHPLTGDWGISSKSVVPNSPVSEVTLYICNVDSGDLYT